MVKEGENGQIKREEKMWKVERDGTQERKIRALTTKIKCLDFIALLISKNSSKDFKARHAVIQF